MGKSPKISIVSTVYNTRPFLETAVQSILSQTFQESLSRQDGQKNCAEVSQNAQKDRSRHNMEQRPHKTYEPGHDLYSASSSFSFLPHAFASFPYISRFF